MATSEYTAERTMERIYREFSDKVLRYARSKISDLHDAEDVCSTVFLRVQQGLPRYDSAKASLSTWIYSIARNTVADFYRHTRAVEPLNEEIVCCEEDGLENLYNDETLEALAAALESLPKRESDIIVLHYYSGKQLKEIAVLMKMSYSNIKSLHKKALAHLKKLLQFRL